MKLIDLSDTALIVIDVQGKLAESMSQRDRLFRNLQVLLQGARILEVPMILTEQVPAKLGPTIGLLQPLLEGLAPITKNAFSCVREPEFTKRLESLQRKTVVLCGIEAHVCVYQTAIDLLANGYRVELVVDAVDSRNAFDRDWALERMKTAGAGGLSLEMLLFELQRVAEGNRFRKLIELVKSR